MWTWISEPVLAEALSAVGLVYCSMRHSVVCEAVDPGDDVDVARVHHRVHGKMHRGLLS